MEYYTSSMLADTMKQKNKIYFVETRLERMGFPFFCPQIRKPSEAAKLIYPVMDGAVKETLWVMYLLNGSPAGLEKVSTGITNACPVPMREVLQSCFLCNANQLILFHNHLSGDITPSSEDIAITERMKKAGELLGIQLLDHIIMGNVDASFTSLREANYLQ